MVCRSSIIEEIELSSRNITFIYIQNAFNSNVFKMLDAYFIVTEWDSFINKLLELCSI